MFYAHGDERHDYQWIFQIYSLHGYSFLKIIQIFLRTLKEFNQSRAFIKYLSKIEEIILSSMVWTKDSTFWNEFDKKGFLSYQQLFPSTSTSTSVSTSTSTSTTTMKCDSTPNSLSSLYCPSPSKHVSRRLFHSNEVSHSSLLSKFNDQLF